MVLLISQETQSGKKKGFIASDIISGNESRVKFYNFVTMVKLYTDLN